LYSLSTTATTPQVFESLVKHVVFLDRQATIKSWGKSRLELLSGLAPFSASTPPRYTHSLSSYLSFLSSPITKTIIVSAPLSSEKPLVFFGWPWLWDQMRFRQITSWPREDGWVIASTKLDGFYFATVFYAEFC